MYNPTLLAKNNRLVGLHKYSTFGIKIHSNGLPGEGEVLSFCLVVGRITGDCHFYIALMGTLGLISPVTEGANLLFFWGGGIGQHNVTYSTHADLVVMSRI